MYRCRPTTQTAEQGFTLLELMITVSLMAAFISAVHESVITGLRVAYAAHQHEQARQQLIYGFEYVAREFHDANGIDDSVDATFQFDKDTPSPVNAIEYTYDANADTLSRRVGNNAWLVIIRNLTAFDYSYIGCTGTSYPAGTAVSATEDTLRVVQLTATVTIGNESVSTATAIYLPNMRGMQSGTCGSA